MTKRSRTRKPKSSPAKPLTLWGKFWRYTFYAVAIVTLLMVIWTIYLDIQVREKFEGKKWALPARVYAQPLELYQGLSLTPALFEQELKALGYSANGDIRKPGNYVKKNHFISGVDYQIHSRGMLDTGSVVC